MILFLLAYLGGVLTIVSPCILPVLPFVFARADRPFVRNGLPLLAGMAITFAAVATLAAVGGGWAVQANEYGRVAALGLLALFGITLLVPSLSDRLTRPLVALGSRLSQSIDEGGGVQKPALLPSFLLGIATGLLWAPCAGPILGLILTGAALQGANVQTSLLLLAYAAGAATSLALALLVGRRVFARMKRSLGVSEWIKRGLGAIVLVAVGTIALGLDTGFLTNASLASTTSIEQSLVDTLHAAPGTHATGPQSPAVMSGAPGRMTSQTADGGENLPVEGTLPSLSGAVEWLNSPPLTREALKGKVVLVDFWTYSCINCLRTLPYVRAWADKYKDQGLVVIGVHSPEFAFEKNTDNVRHAVAKLKIDYPVAIDNNYAIWRAFNNEYWPADYFIDAEGHIRHHAFGEGDYQESERVIQELLRQAGQTHVPTGFVSVDGSGVEAPPDMSNIQSPETYIGYDRAQNFISPGGEVHDVPHAYTAAAPQLNEWALSGNWTIGGQHAGLNEGGGSITYRFHARDLNLVLGTPSGSKPIRFRVTIDGMAPGANHGTDDDADGQGVVTGQRLYQLVRQTGAISNRTFQIQFLESGLQAYAFTFG
ncbi:MAG: cytochrome c biogenesis protein DipZ [Rhodoferax sp.]